MERKPTARLSNAKKGNGVSEQCKESQGRQRAMQRKTMAQASNEKKGNGASEQCKESLCHEHEQVCTSITFTFTPIGRTV